MKKGLKIFLIVVAVIVLFVLIAFARLGYLPGVAKVFGWDKPRDLGIVYTKADFQTARAKSKVIYEELPSTTIDSASIQFSGVRDIDTSWNSAEITSLMNNRPWKYWPISQAQLRINSDNTVELSGVFNREKLVGYGKAIGVPQAILERASILPNEAPFYLKGSSSLAENKVATFDISEAQMGRMSLPASVLLSFIKPYITSSAYAADLGAELSQYSGKKAAIVDFINSKLAWINGFYAKKANFSDGKLYFQGTLPEKELSIR